MQILLFYYKFYSILLFTPSLWVDIFFEKYFKKYKYCCCNFMRDMFSLITSNIFHEKCWGGDTQGLMANMLDCDIIISELKLQLYSYIYFWTNTLGKSMNSLIPPVCQWPGRPGFNPRSSHTKDSKKMVLDATLLNTQHYKVRTKDKVEQSRERSNALPYTLV